jgi:hypothetical protein
MRDRVWILAGLAAFFVVLSFPVWANLVRHRREAGKLVLPVPAHAADCVMPVSYMRTSHMKLLFRWRDEAVRENIHTFKAYDGKMYNISLTGTCLSCHNKAQFCDRCHDYAGVRPPSCWSCHVDPTLTAESSR